VDKLKVQQNRLRHLDADSPQTNLLGHRATTIESCRFVKVPNATLDANGCSTYKTWRVHFCAQIISILFSQEDDKLNLIPPTGTLDTSVSGGVSQDVAERATKIQITKESTSKRKGSQVFE
jgi:hypothetical protein